MSVRVYIEQLGSIGPHRMAALNAEGLVSDWYVMVGPDRPAGRVNRFLWNYYAGVGNLWAWYVCTADQAKDVADIAALDSELMPAGWLLNVEKALEHADLSVLISGVKALGQPIVASLSGGNPNHNLYDHRTLDRAGVVCEWQAYLDSGEGPDPATAVRELYKVSRVGEGMEYRAQIDRAYGWGEVNGLHWLGGTDYQSFAKKATFEFVTLADGGWPALDVEYRELHRPPGTPRGELLGLAAYKNIRITLDVTRTAQAQRDLAGWEALAASARVPGASKRGVSVYLGEVCPDDVLRAIARSAGG